MAPVLLTDTHAGRTHWHALRFDASSASWMRQTDLDDMTTEHLREVFNHYGTESLDLAVQLCVCGCVCVCVCLRGGSGGGSASAVDEE